MRHRRNTKYFGRPIDSRRALFRSLVDALVKHERIQTTVEKAKELRRHVEKAITMGKSDTLHTRRLLLARYPTKDTTFKIVNDLSKRFVDRPGGYTRIIKTGFRPGDAAELAFIEFVDYDYEKHEAPVKSPEKIREEKKAKSKQRKKLRQIQVKSRHFNRD